MKISRSFALYVVMLGLVLLGAASAWSQTNFSVKIYAEDGSTSPAWKDSVYIGKYTSATDAIGDSIDPILNETELPPVPPAGPDQAADFRIVDQNGADAYPYGQGVRVDIRNLVSDGQKNVYRIIFRRGDPDGSGITLSWPAGLDAVSAGGFYLTDGLDGALFDPIDMTTQTSYTNIAWATTSGGFADIVVGDGSMYRTFTSAEIALAADLKGKVGKYEKAKPIAVDFGITLTVPPGGADRFYIEFDKIVEGVISFSNDTDGHLPINISGLKKYDILSFPPGGPLDEGVTVEITGTGLKGKLMKGKYGFTLGGSKLVKTAFVTHDEYLRLPIPNVNNIGNEMFLQPSNLSIGMNNGVGLSNSIGTNGKGKPVIRHIRLEKWKDVTKTLYKFKNIVIMQDDSAFCLDMINSKENIKMLKSLAPDKTVRYKGSTKIGNKLIGQMVALKFNIASSALGHTPSSNFRDLVYTNPGHPFDGADVDSIAIYGDYALACTTGAGGRAGLNGLPPGWSSQDMADFLETLNEEFSNGVFDTVSWSGTLTVATGVKSILLSSIFTTSGPSNDPVAAPGDFSSLYQTPATFSLSQNYPNPFNPTTTIEFSLPEDAFVTLTVYNMLGQEVAKLADHEEFTSGENWVELDAANFSSGVYYYTIVVNDGQFRDVRKMVLMK